MRYKQISWLYWERFYYLIIGKLKEKKISFFKSPALIVLVWDTDLWGCDAWSFGSHLLMMRVAKQRMDKAWWRHQWAESNLEPPISGLLTNKLLRFKSLIHVTQNVSPVPGASTSPGSLLETTESQVYSRPTESEIAFQKDPLCDSYAH